MAKLWQIFFQWRSAAASQNMGSKGKTARQWCAEKNFIAAINAGMFNNDYKTHTGYFRIRDHINNGKTNGYKSVAAFHPNRPGLPQFRIFDLDTSDVSIDRISKDYTSAVQNLRLMKKPGINKWGGNKKSGVRLHWARISPAMFFLYFRGLPFQCMISTRNF